MENTKKWWESKAIQGALVVAAVSAVNSFTGYTIGDDLVPVIKDNLESLILLVGGIYSIYGRVVATKKIG